MEYQDLSEIIKQSYKNGTPLRITGSQTKNFYGAALHGEKLSVLDYSGIVDYEPSELVLTVKAGTPLREIEELLRSRGQMLAFEPPHYGENATLGGSLACGFSGPRRPFADSAGSYTLGVKICDGRGRILSYGGRVMKNVAGYDVSRIMTGSMGTLGVLLEISLKVLPLPDCELTLKKQMGLSETAEFFSAIARKPFPLSGAAWVDGAVYVRLSGNERAVAKASRTIGYDEKNIHGHAPADRMSDFWYHLKEHTLPFFSSDENLWRLSLSQTWPFSSDRVSESDIILDWMGALRWIRDPVDPEKIFSEAENAGGHAVLFRRRPEMMNSSDYFMKLGPEALKIHRRIKKIFDPGGILNPGRMHREF
ncbi:MAG: glycolate oxidase subunit GlcE [Spirochaetia bacterium]|nr:glycolate oxidase subunit GlcE [Spirochaetia bacterium]